MKISVFVAASLDGYIARPNGDLDWLPAEGELPEGEDYGFGAFMATVDALVIGRRTYEKVLTFRGWPYGDKPVVVLTSRPSSLPPPPAPTVETMAGEPREIVGRLAERGMKHLYVDGGVTIQRFLDAGLVGSVTINRIPILLGGGIPLFGPMRRDVRLRHVSTRRYPSGFVQSEYLVPARVPCRMGRDVHLRDVTEADLPVFFEHQRDPDGVRMAAFTSRDLDAFLAHWTKILHDGTTEKRTIVLDGRVAGNVVCFEHAGKREVGYWIGKEFWGQGVATRALEAFLREVTTRPLYAHVAKHNLASIRVLEKCGVARVGVDEAFARVGGETVEGYVLELE